MLEGVLRVRGVLGSFRGPLIPNFILLTLLENLMLQRKLFLECFLIGVGINQVYDLLDCRIGSALKKIGHLTGMFVDLTKQSVSVVRDERLLDEANRNGPIRGFATIPS